MINRNTEKGTISVTINVKRLLGQIKVLAITIAVLYLGVYQAVNNALYY